MLCRLHFLHDVRMRHLEPRLSDGRQDLGVPPSSLSTRLATLSSWFVGGCHGRRPWPFDFSLLKLDLLAGLFEQHLPPCIVLSSLSSSVSLELKTTLAIIFWNRPSTREMNFASKHRNGDMINCTLWSYICAHSQ
jgi:hypothetical protein